jgi:chemotaxis protein histidine kinase CheA
MAATDDDMVFLFHAESVDLLDDMEESLLYLQDNDWDKERVNAIFRAIHTIKGGAAMFHFVSLVEFTHTAESLLDKLRNREIPLDDSLISLLLEVKDHVNELIEDIIQNDSKELYSDELIEKSQNYIDKLNGYLQSKKDAPSQEVRPALQDKEQEQVKKTELKTEPKNETPKEPSKTQSNLLKIESNKIDSIINLLGEMVITTAGVMQHAQRI